MRPVTPIGVATGAEPVTPHRYVVAMTAHEILISLFWLVALAYGLYLGWFARNALRDARHKHHNGPE